MAGWGLNDDSPDEGTVTMSFNFDLRQIRIGVMGLGYVGLPLAVAFGKRYPTLGFDMYTGRIAELQAGQDSSLEVEPAELWAAEQLTYTDEAGDLANCNLFIITVPTPINVHKQPDLRFLRSASSTIGTLLKTGDVVIYESTVYPGATEEICIPILEQISKLAFNWDFFVGYSPERINPGDKEHRLTTIKKVTSGSTPEVADFVDALYRSIIPAGTHKASSIQVAEAAKIIENTQRDVNIALVNELALIFNHLGIDTQEVLEAAGSKWNFLPFRPGLVGGHCIGVDPYYLTYKAQAVGYQPEIILAGRHLNDRMGAFVASRVIKLMAQRNLVTKGSRVLILGLAFKENCPDPRNTRVVDILGELDEYGIAADVHDPWVNRRTAKEGYGITLIEDPQPGSYDAIILAVAHRQFKDMGIKRLRALGRSGAVFFDVKHVFPADVVDGRL